ncbi:DUF916 and DUF3324 domain-containing protein [Companilactobacillus kimchii]|uniref:Cell surface protein n=1 Tax=Companilactobacillus kimchii TaxID=2801452 RepID=A0A210P6J6_9LACO|nr:DUF916 and DUF3324 domain-containing protein [Companilactobacillus kimchii]KAE9559691.1 cell surface protein [Companilactobacillus kimchii]OWF32109.1 hypothetical protein LKACC12383_02345 [Companilactobacillus kimchii]GEO47943.1 cell surface protein [Companilactobacillus paralimentarius]
MKKRIWIFMLFLISVITFGCLGTQNVLAATSEAQPAVTYNIVPELSNDQIDKKVGYFDLKVTPNQKLQAKFRINNNDTKTHTYTVMVNRASTDTNGVIVYNEHNVKADSSLKYDIEKLVTYPKSVTVDAKSSKEVVIDINAPKGNFDGVLLGGIFIEQDNQVSKSNAKGVTLKNKYNYVLGLQLRQSTATVEPNLKLVRAYEDTKNGQITVNALLDNDVPRLEEKVDIKAKVTSENNSKDVILQSEKSNMSIAPNSYFAYPTNVNTVIGTNKDKRLKPGTYMLYLNVKANDGQNTWKLQRKFTVTGKQSREINKKTPVKNSHAKSNMAIIETVAAIIVVAGLGVWYYKKHRK